MPSTVKRIKEELLRFKKTGETDLKDNSFARYVWVMKRESPGWIEKNEIFKKYDCPKWKNGKKKHKKNKFSTNYIKDTKLTESEEKYNQQGVREEYIALIRTPHSVLTAEQMAEICNIDDKYWYAKKIVSNVWGNENYPCWQFKVWWGKRTDLTPEEAVESYERLLENYKPIKFDEYNYNSGDKLLEISIMDPHIGRLSWYQVTSGKNYDLKESVSRYLGINHYYTQQFKDVNLDRVLLVIGNDFFNVNSAANTTVNNTAQEEDTRFEKSFDYGCELVINVIEMWRKIAPVDVCFIKGNHDEERLYYLGSNIKYAYKYMPASNVTIDNSPKSSKAYTYGKNLIMFTHKLSKPQRANDIILADYRGKLANAEYVEVHTGHFHNEKVVESIGNLTIRTVPSIAEPSTWETDMGYRSLKKAMAFLWDKNGGLVDIRYCNL